MLCIKTLFFTIKYILLLLLQDNLTVDISLPHPYISEWSREEAAGIMISLNLHCLKYSPLLALRYVCAVLNSRSQCH